MGYAARFVTGYIQMGHAQHGATHAWTEVYLPGAGWRGFDPTNNKLVGFEHVSVAVTCDHEKASPLSAQELRCNLVMDLIYRPFETRLLKLAKRKRIATVSGLEMFLAQGFAQWEVWTNTKPPESVMRRAVLSKLRADGSAR